MMIEPQRLEYNDKESSPPTIVIQFDEFDRPVDFMIKKVIETAYNALKSNATDLFYRKQCCELIKCYLAASIRLDDNAEFMFKFFMHPSFKNDEICQQQNIHKNVDTADRYVQQIALTALFVATGVKELRQSVLGTMFSIVRHFTMIIVAQQAGPFVNKLGTGTTGQDPLVLIDALAVIMGNEEKELCKPGNLALMLILETATNILGTKERACQLPVMEYLAEKMKALCYERAWYAKLGGCIAIKFLFENMDTKWILKHLFVFLKALIFVMQVYLISI